MQTIQRKAHVICLSEDAYRYVKSRLDLTASDSCQAGDGPAPGGTCTGCGNIGEPHRLRLVSEEFLVADFDEFDRGAAA